MVMNVVRFWGYLKSSCMSFLYLYRIRNFASSLPEISLGILGIGKNLFVNCVQPYYPGDIFFCIKVALKRIFNITFQAFEGITLNKNGLTERPRVISAFRIFLYQRYQFSSCHELPRLFFTSGTVSKQLFKIKPDNWIIRDRARISRD